MKGFGVSLLKAGFRKQKATSTLVPGGRVSQRNKLRGDTVFPGGCCARAKDLWIYAVVLGTQIGKLEITHNEMEKNMSLDDWLADGEAKQRNAELAQITEVCTVPSSAQRIMKKVQREDASIPDLIAAISQDPAVANRLLRVANSSASGEGGQVSNLQDAVIVVGRKELRSLTADTPVLIAGTAGHDLALHFVSSSVLSATLAQALATELDWVEPPTAYLCGLLSQIGTLAFISVDPEGYSSIWKDSGGNLEILGELEKRRYGIINEQLALDMLKRNRLPKQVFEPVGTALTTLPDDMTLDTQVVVFARLAAPMIIIAARGGNRQILSTSIPALAAQFELSDVTGDHLIKICLESAAITELTLRQD